MDSIKCQTYSVPSEGTADYGPGGRSCYSFWREEWQENDSRNVGVVQIASRLVRCVQSSLNLGETESARRRLGGMIRLGALVAVVLTHREDLDIQVKPGERRAS